MKLVVEVIGKPYGPKLTTCFESCKLFASVVKLDETPKF